MKKQDHLTQWDQQRLRHGITLRLIEQLSDAQLTSRPVAQMRTPVELLVHAYMTVKLFPQAVVDGKLGTYDETAAVDSIRTRAQLLEFVKQAWAAGDKTARSLTDAQLASVTSTPWGDFPGAAMIGIVYDEYLHHRGQLYAYLRVLGIEPVMVWDFDHSAAEFQPRELAQS